MEFVLCWVDCTCPQEDKLLFPFFVVVQILLIKYSMMYIIFCLPFFIVNISFFISNRAGLHKCVIQCLLTSKRVLLLI